MNNPCEVENNEGRLKHSFVSPYSGVVIDVDTATNHYEVRLPIEFRPKYATPIAQGEPVPY